MAKNSPAKGHHGLGARGQGKLLYFHTRVTYAIRHSKEQMLRKYRKPPEYRQANGHWAGLR
ncbi:hypothetical protein Caci_1714 [Catenulispora acidiphila DSM 44928]|uniref:Uncharacterized protein n=1 Tax=Catenulispora acidiphila (strain DSM 44928 / JCM 14897 / NBRC 102108 / NRRL B-24433 / ID139908) TaxID=479433 RepID=C7QBQ8_CATAD|nr:hypothetical protein [Catenulispora acidiphila]ACU70635.1 hypothetical protein Caci_1714 [Catenulispora acidiphila DSM 44928]